MCLQIKYTTYNSINGQKRSVVSTRCWFTMSWSSVTAGTFYLIHSKCSVSEVEIFVFSKQIPLLLIWELRRILIRCQGFLGNLENSCCIVRRTDLADPPLSALASGWLTIIGSFGGFFVSVFVFNSSRLGNASIANVQ